MKKHSAIRRSIIHQLQTETAGQIFRHSQYWYAVEFNRADIPEFIRKLYYENDKKFSKFAPILFPNSGQGKSTRDYTKFLQCETLTLVRTQCP